MVVEHWRFLNALFVSAHTLATGSFGETHPLSHAGPVFTVILIFAGESGILIALGTELGAFALLPDSKLVY